MKPLVMLKSCMKLSKWSVRRSIPLIFDVWQSNRWYSKHREPWRGSWQCDQSRYGTWRWPPTLDQTVEAPTSRESPEKKERQGICFPQALALELHCPTLIPTCQNHHHTITIYPTRTRDIRPTSTVCVNDFVKVSINWKVAMFKHWISVIFRYNLNPEPLN